MTRAILAIVALVAATSAQAQMFTLIPTGPVPTLPAPAPKPPLHPNIEDRRTDDTSLYAPLIPYAAELKTLPWMPAPPR